MAIKIPQQGKFYQPNSSDLFGNLWYTRNMNFNESGYAKLSSRMVSVISGQDDLSFQLPISFGRQDEVFHVVTADQAYDFSTEEGAFSITEDTSGSNPSLSYDSWGRWFQNRWHAATNTKIWYETATGSGWTDTGASLTTGKVHPMEVFRNKNSLAVGNGNTVQLLATNYATSVTLTIPADYEVVGLAYSNAKMGVVTMMSDSAAGQNQEAYFFIWDGASTSAGLGFPVGADTIMGIAAYKSSWVILTRTGELKYWNGGGFETLATLPFTFMNTTWAGSQARDAHGDIMAVEREIIHINIGNDLDTYGRYGEDYVQNNPAGVWCYDPNVGLYHRYSYSISPVNQITVVSGDVNTTTNVITKTSGTIYETGSPIKQITSADTPLGGVQIGKVYYTIKLSSTTFALAETKALAAAGTKVDITAANDAKFLTLNVLDYGTTRAGRFGGLAFVETRNEQADHLVAGADITDFNSNIEYEHLCATVPRFENRGYFVTAKSTSNEVLDNTQKVFVKYRPLDTYDKIIVKYRDTDILGIPTNTPQFTRTPLCTWVDANTFTTTSNLSVIESFINDSSGECEVEILTGAGAGQMAQISSISENAGTYTVNLAEDIDGVTAGYTCDVLINNWKLLKTKEGASSITSSDTTGYKEFPIATSSKWIQFKVELRGFETTVEEFQIVNETQLASV